MEVESYCQERPERSGRNGPLTGRNGNTAARPGTSHSGIAAKGEKQEK